MINCFYIISYNAIPKPADNQESAIHSVSTKIYNYDTWLRMEKARWGDLEEHAGSSKDGHRKDLRLLNETRQEVQTKNI